ncbi:hypothetical protein F2Q68_00023587 [Brassica cretica]|uniref:Uncharacterized protein n=1 Tax=Brassica cretica TaxID=69181 RepID=A0A8S9FRB1_BRACR|nr:hypothetical protein F2Q68_00023587 [Brassica cretica]
MLLQDSTIGVRLRVCQVYAPVYALVYAPVRPGVRPGVRPRVLPGLRSGVRPRVRFHVCYSVCYGVFLSVRYGVHCSALYIALHHSVFYGVFLSVRYGVRPEYTAVYAPMYAMCTPWYVTGHSVRLCLGLPWFEHVIPALEPIARAICVSSGCVLPVTAMAPDCFV